MVIAPFMVGAIAGGFAWVHVPLLAFWLIGYFAFFATSQWLRSGRRSASCAWAIGGGSGGGL